MQSSGLLWKYKVNRPLTDDERAHQLKQKEHLDVEPIDQLSVIKANSTYLEVVDKYYAMKGWFTMWSFVLATVLIGIIVFLIVHAFMSNDVIAQIIFLVFSAIAFTPLLLISIWLFKKESFTYTHYPVRFNRKTRMVHIFMTDGRQLSVPWDDIFFYLAAGDKGEKGDWDLRGHILDKDGKTVLDTFAMMHTYPSDTGKALVIRQWEFIRRYMEESHADIIKTIKECMPLDNKYETWKIAFARLHSEFRGETVPIILTILFTPLVLALTPFRMLAMHTSKLPLWNKEIEAANVIEADDPYIKDSRINPEGLR